MSIGHRVPKIEVRGVSKHYRLDGAMVPVLDRVSLYAREAEFVSLIGPSGCGKSTLFNIVAGLEEPTAGEIYINGQRLPSRLGAVGYMPQKDLLLPWRSILDNAIIGLEVQGVPKAAARQEALKYFQEFGLQGFQDSYPFALSGGMRQRAAFLRTLLLNKEVVLLDEPFGALDALTRSNMQEWLLHIWDTFKKTIVFITHDVEEAIFLSDRIYVLTARPGRVERELTVPLPRPRSYDMVTSDLFVRLKQQLLAAIKEESVKAVSQGWGV